MRNGDAFNPDQPEANTFQLKLFKKIRLARAARGDTLNLRKANKLARVTSGSDVYLVPDQIILPAITPTCELQTQSSSLASTTSISALFKANHKSYVYRIH